MNEYYNSYDRSPYDPMVGFERGNLFDTLYTPYKNYRPIKINPANEKEYLMYQIQVYSFALNELGLYLDNFPNDATMIKLRNEYLKAYNESYIQYENKYGALSLGSPTLNKTPWQWDSAFPWEKANKRDDELNYWKGDNNV